MLVMAGWIETVIIELRVWKGTGRCHVIGGLIEHKGIDDDVFLAE